MTIIPSIMHFFTYKDFTNIETLSTSLGLCNLRLDCVVMLQIIIVRIYLEKFINLLYDKS